MLGSGNNFNRGSALLSSDAPSLPQCLPLDPITLGNKKNSCSGELKRALGVSSGSTLEDHPFGVAHPKCSPSVASKELKHFKDNVQDSSRRARERADMLRESLFKLDKYREALSCRKRQHNEISPSERLGGGNLSKMGSQIHRNAHDITHRLEDRPKSLGLNKRARSSISDVQAETRFTTIMSNPTFSEKDGDKHQLVNDGCPRNEEKTRRLLAGGEGFDKKIKKKRSVGAVGFKVNGGDQELNRATHTKLNSDSKLRTCDAQGYRLKSSSGVTGINRFESSSDPTRSDVSTLSKNELESAIPVKGRTFILEQRMLKGNSRANNREDNLGGSPSTVIKGKISRGPRTGSVMGLDSSLNIHSSSGTAAWESASPSKGHLTGPPSNQKQAVLTSSSLYPITQWVGQRHKNSRTRRSKLPPPVPNRGESPSPSQDITASDVCTRTIATNGSVLASGLDNSTTKFRREMDNASSPVVMSESEESGPGHDRVRRKDTGSDKLSLSAAQEVGSFVFPVRKNKILVNEIGDGVRRQGRSGRGHPQVKPDSPSVRDKSDNLCAEKPLQNMKPGPVKIRSKSGRPPSKKLKDRRTLSHAGLTCRSSDITGESDDDQEQLFEAANSARNANIRACTGPFWRKMNSIFAPVSPEDAANLKQQLKLAEELGERLSQMQDSEHNNLGLGVHVVVTNCSGEIRGSNSSKELITAGAERERFDLGRLDKAVPLYQRVLSALIEEHDCDEYYHRSEGKHMFMQSASDDSHCDSCNLNDYEHRDRDRVDWEAESVDFQMQKNHMVDRFSCDKSVSNSYRKPSMSSSIHGGNLWPGDDDLSNSDVGHVSEICSNDFFQLEPGDVNEPSISSDCQYQMMRLDDKILLELQSIGLYPETLPDLAEGEDLINQGIMEHKKSLAEQIQRKKSNLGKVEKSIHRGKDNTEKRKVEEVAMDQLVEMAYNKKMGHSGNHTSKSMVRKISKSAARSLMRRTLTRCHKFEDSGISCFSEPALKNILFSDPPNNDGNFGGSTTATNPFDETSLLMADQRSGAISGPFERYESHSDTLDKGSSNAQALNSSEQGSKRGSVLVKGKKREMRIDEVAGSASSRMTSGLTPGIKGKRSEREREPNKNHSLSNFFYGAGQSPIDGDLQKPKAKPSQKNNSQSSSGNRFGTQVLGLPESCNMGGNGVGNKTRERESRGREESAGFINNNMQLHELEEELDVSRGLEEHQDLGSWLDIDDDGLQDHDDAIGLQIPMDDLSELNMLM